ncbi:hypothetical protein DACRYDRAFT_21684 [Dacryopinax primogenitus]|uniref:Translation elongation factor EFTs/EF1B dimerisation domain-containing protein n=1 Tax=Dacryopinax primogenitus (strain DJM 731) TaxID=1858805 RepID=M5G359_DACPD|nr:uncharacterized protein DACRYDRAFT_21684 [Dacryopinax primogenitus]EJU02655.1 hypothetical protein DACRYDRAFT_21684 [Dacryopinax primogenitus]
MTTRLAVRAFAFIPPFIRCRYNSSDSVKVPLELIRQLRQHVPAVTLPLARTALRYSGLDVPKAVEYVHKFDQTILSERPGKVYDRAAGEGVIAISVPSPGLGAIGNLVRGGMVELNCETDFVSRSGAFNVLATKIAHTVAFFAERTPDEECFSDFDLKTLEDAPLCSQTGDLTVQAAVKKAVSEFKENITIRRAVSLLVQPPSRKYIADRVFYAGWYAHGSHRSEIGETGKVGSLLLLAASPDQISDQAKLIEDMSKLSKNLARQTTGFETLSIRTDEPLTDADSASTILYHQQFAMHGTDQTVDDVLQTYADKWDIKRENGVGMDVRDLRRWTVGEGMPAKVDTFAEEVRKMAGESP